MLVLLLLLLQYLAASREPWVPTGLDESCNGTYGNLGPRTGPPDSLSGLKSKLKAKLKSDGIVDEKIEATLEGYGYGGYDVPDYQNYPADGPGVKGFAVVLAGPITSISNLRHATEYKQGVMQFVPIWFPFPAGPDNQPLVKPGSIKVGGPMLLPRQSHSLGACLVQPHSRCFLLNQLAPTHRGSGGSGGTRQRCHSTCAVLFCTSHVPAVQLAG